MRRKTSLALAVLTMGLLYGQGTSAAPLSVDDHLEQCQAYYVEGKLSEAIRELLSARVMDPQNAQVRFMLGNAYFRNGDFEAALESYQDAVLVRPEHPDTHLNLGFTLHRLERLDEAREAWFAAKALSPEDPMIRSAIALAEQRLGEPDAALFHYSIAVYLEAECFDMEYYRRDVRWSAEDVLAMEDVKAFLLQEEAR